MNEMSQMTPELEQAHEAVRLAQNAVENAEGPFVYAAVFELRAAEIRRDILICELNGKEWNPDGVHPATVWNHAARLAQNTAKEELCSAQA